MADTANPAGAPKVTDIRITPAPPGSVAPPSDKPDQFQKFESLAGKLAQVPKSELDEK